MKRYNNRVRLFGSLLVAAIAGMLTFGACTEVDDTLGVEFIPDNQEMKVGFKRLDRREAAGRRFFETRLFKSDSVESANLSYGYLGTMENDTFGLCKAGFYSQYVSYYVVDSGYFGYRPIFDSMQLLLSIADYAGDTTVVQHFEIYEVVADDFLTESADTVFYTAFDPTPYLSERPIFTFDFPDGETTGPATTAVTLTPTEEGLKFIDRLLLLDGEEKDDYGVYDDYDTWVEHFKGIYIRPKSPVAGGALYSTTLSSSGLAMYCRNRDEQDPMIVKDTVGAVYYFYDDYATAGNVSINTIDRDYTNSLFNIDEIDESSESRPLTPTCFVEGFGGVVTEISFTEDFFEAIAEILDEEQASTGERYRSLAINQAVLSIYLADSDYDWMAVDPAAITPWLDYYAERLGLYTNYKTKTAVPDYYYTYEQTYSTTLPFDGYLNRSLGCYTMDISSYVQLVWNRYLNEVAAAAEEGRQPDLNNVKGSTVYLAPEAYSYFTYTHASAQGMDDESNNAPMRVDLTYTLIK